MYQIRLLARRLALRGRCLHGGRFLRALSKLGCLVCLGIVGFAVVGITGCGTLTCVDLCFIILIMGWSFLFNSSVILLRPQTAGERSCHLGEEERESVSRWVSW